MASTQHLISIKLKLIDEMSKGLDKSVNSLKKMGDSISSVGNKMTMGITMPLVALGAGMMKTFAEFDSVMTEIGARTGATAEEMKKMSDFAIKMGRDTKFSATEAAQALLELTSSGSSAADAMKQLPAVLALAAAGSIELGRAADGVTDIMAQFQLEVKESAEVADILTKAAGASSATVESMLQAFGNVGPVAKMFGMSVADTAAALAVLHENGIKAGEAGTNLKSMLQNMARDTLPVGEAWTKLGLSLYDAQGNMRNIDDLFKDINVAMKDMTMEEQNRIAQDLAGSYGILAFQSLRTANGFSTMRDSMNSAAGAQEVAEKMANTLSGRWEQLMGSIETLAIVLGQLAAGPLTDLMWHLTNIINAITDWVSLNPQMAQWIMIILGIVAAIGPLLSMIGGLIGMFAAMPAVIAAIATAIGFLFTPLGALAAAILFVAAVWNNWFGIRDALMGFFSGIVQGVYWVIGVLGEVGNVMGKVVMAFAEGWQRMFEYAGQAAAQLAQIIGTTLGRLVVIGLAIGKSIIEGLIKGISLAIINLIKFVQEKAAQISQAIRNAFGIHSPSKIMAKIGEQVVAGFHEGIKSMGGVGVDVPSTSGGVQSRQPSLSYAGAGAGGSGNIIIQNLNVPAGTTREQAMEVMKIIGKESERRGAKKIK